MSKLGLKEIGLVLGLGGSVTALANCALVKKPAVQTIQQHPVADLANRVLGIYSELKTRGELPKYIHAVNPLGNQLYMLNLADGIAVMIAPYWNVPGQVPKQVDIAVIDNSYSTRANTSSDSSHPVPWGSIVISGLEKEGTFHVLSVSQIYKYGDGKQLKHKLGSNELNPEYTAFANKVFADWKLAYKN